MLLFLLGFLVGLAVASVAALVLHKRAVRLQRLHAADAERRAAESEHLAELGTMTGGLAHEIKNPLSTIGLNTDLLREDLADLESVDEDEKRRLTNRLVTVSREVDRLRGILDDFLQFAGQIHLDPEPHDLNKLVEELADFYQPQADRAGVRILTQTDPSPVIVEVDSHRLKQAVLNLLINATQALESSSHPDQPKELMLRVERNGASSVIKGIGAASPEAPPIPEAVLHVTDTGPGISQEDIKRIFRPYFSTKRGGTGLGLPTTRRIIDAHQGRLEVYSEPDQGTDFVIRLPLAENENT